MRIGVDIRSLSGPIHSGVGEYVDNLLNALAERDRSNEYYLYSNAFKRTAGTAGEIDNMHFHYRRFRTPNILNHFTLRFFRFPKLDKKLKTDIFFAPNLNFLALENFSKAIITVHDLSFLRFKEYFSKKRIAWHNSLGVGSILRKAGRVVAVSENTKNDIVELYRIKPEKIKVIYSGIDRGTFSGQEPETGQSIKLKYDLPDKYILCLGTVEPRKNTVGAIEAYEIFRQKNKSFRELKLVIAGAPGWKTSHFYEKLHSSAYRDDIILTGYISRNEKKAIYSQALMLLYPSFYEGFGFPPLEAMACNIPVIAGQNSSMAEILKDSALLVNPADSNEIAEAIGRLAACHELRQEYSARGAIKAKEYSWDAAADKYLDLFNSLA